MHPSPAVNNPRQCGRRGHKAAVTTILPPWFPELWMEIEPGGFERVRTGSERSRDTPEFPLGNVLGIPRVPDLTQNEEIQTTEPMRFNQKHLFVKASLAEIASFFLSPGL